MNRKNSKKNNEQSAISFSFQLNMRLVLDRGNLIHSSKIVIIITRNVYYSSNELDAKNSVQKSLYPSSNGVHHDMKVNK